MRDGHHLNNSGAKKFTSYFGKFLLENNYIGQEHLNHSKKVIDNFNLSYKKSANK